jgi:hypothetical protein
LKFQSGDSEQLPGDHGRRFEKEKKAVYSQHRAGTEGGWPEPIGQSRRLEPARWIFWLP